MTTRAPGTGDDPIPKRSAVNLDAVESVPLGSLTKRLGRLGGERVRQVCGAMVVAVDCDP